MTGERFGGWLRRFCNAVFALCFGAVLLSMLIYGSVYIDKMPAQPSNRLCLLLALVWLGAVLCFAWLCSRAAWLRRFFSEWKGVLVAFAALLAAQWTVTLCIYTICGWDPQIVLSTANDLLLGHPYDGTYFHQNPNNLFLLSCFRLIFTVLNRLGFVDYLPWMACLSALCVNLSLFLLFDLMRRLFGWRAAWLCFLLTAPIIGLSPWIAVPYSDTFGMLFPIGVAYCYIRLRNEAKHRALFSVLLGVCLIVGVRIKPTAVLVVIAACVLELAVFRKGAVSRRGVLRVVVLIALGAAVCYGATAYFQYRATGKMLDPIRMKEERFSLTHYFMLGLSQPFGNYVYQDMEFTMSYKGTQAKTQANLTEAKRRIEEMGPAGFPAFLWRKLNFNLNDGTFFCGREGWYYAGDPPQTSRFAHAVQYFFRADNAGYGLLAIWQQTQWILMLLMLLCGIFYRGNSTQWVLFGRICTLGLVCFVMIFEARSRYLYHFLPVMSLAAMGGVLWLEEMIQKGRTRYGSISANGNVSQNL